MHAPIPEHHPLRRLFAGLVENAFYAEVGMCDPPVAEYLVDLLTEFIHVDRVRLLKNAGGRRLEEVAEMLTDASLGADVIGPKRDRIVHKHIGDYTLYWSGVYPENLKHLKRPDKTDHFVDYLKQGKRSYAIASELSVEQADPPATVLRRLSDNFEFCVYGLGLVRKSWEQLNPDVFTDPNMLPD
jgi:hypothetical protein